MDIRLPGGKVSREPESLDEQALNDDSKRQQLDELILKRLREIHPEDLKEVFDEYDRMTDENL
jgi:hypothetical protein